MIFTETIIAFVCGNIVIINYAISELLRISSCAYIFYILNCLAGHFERVGGGYVASCPPLMYVKE